MKRTEGEPLQTGQVVAWLPPGTSAFVLTWDEDKGSWWTGDGWLTKWLDEMTWAPMPEPPTATATFTATSEPTPLFVRADEHERVKQSMHKLDECLAEWHDLALDITGPIKPPYTDARLRAALLAETEKMARESWAAGRLERKLEALTSAWTAQHTADAECIDAWRKRALDLLGYGTFEHYGSDDGNVWRQLLYMLADDSTLPVRAVIALAMGVPVDPSLTVMLGRFEEAAEDIDKVHAAGVEEGVVRGRLLEHEEAKWTRALAEKQAEAEARQNGREHRRNGIDPGTVDYYRDSQDERAAFEEGWDEEGRQMERESRECGPFIPASWKLAAADPALGAMAFERPDGTMVHWAEGVWTGVSDSRHLSVDP